MSKIKKSLFGRIVRGTLYLFLIFTILIVIAYLFAGQIAQKAVSIVVPPITQTTAAVDKIDLSLWHGYVSLEGLKIGNPTGFSGQNIFEIGRVHVVFEPKSVLSQTIVVRSIIIEGIGASVEMNIKGQTNVSVLNQNIQDYLNAHQTIESNAVQTKIESKTESAKKVIVYDLAITDSHLTLGMAGQMVTVTLPNIYQTDIGVDKNGKTIPEMIAQILSYFSSESIRGTTDAARELMGKGIAGASQLLLIGKENVKQHLNQVNEMLDSDTKNIVDGIKSLF